MKHLLFLTIPLLFIITSCSEHGPIEPAAYTDTELKAIIVGTWSNDYISIKYRSNNTFTENIDVDYIIGDSTINQTEVIRGTYDIVDGVLKYTNITEWYATGGLGTGSSIPNFEIKLDSDFLYLYPLSNLTRVGIGGVSIYGEWYSFEWTHNYNNPLIFSKLERTYNFNKDSMTVTLGMRVSGDSSGVYNYVTLPFTYSPPEISWNANNVWIVEFYGEQMMLHHKLSQLPNPLRKVK